MGHAIAPPRMTAADFLTWDEHETVRHEFARGEVCAMAGGEDRNATIALNLAMALRMHLRGTPCRTFVADVKLRVEADDCFFHSDVMVTCSAADAADYRLGLDGLWVLHPVEPEGSLTLASVDLQVPSATLWDEVPPPDGHVGHPGPLDDERRSGR